MEFTKKFAELLKLEDINQTRLAKEVGVSKQAITNLKNGSSLPSLELLCDLARYFNVTTDYLLGLEDESGRKITQITNSFNNNSGNIDFKN